MQIQAWLKQNPAVAIAFAAIVLAIALLILLYGSGLIGSPAPTSTSKFYYYDVQSGELFADQANLNPPIKAPSGGDGVLAQVYGCGDCSGEPFVGLLKTYTPAAKKAIEKGLPPGPGGELVRLPGDDTQWVPADSDAGRKLRLDSVAAARAHCKGVEPTPCFPE